ncbi:hypothetical protein PQX77_000891 [Marasmius sp. AFHP31]|nr:hypothetical protein PQX77_008922 [Marasmius sp. AFHP31]KAK1235861.1 hypothetical protein PQX77_000891 [Marasmius sp. AFHP31]
MSTSDSEDDQEYIPPVEDPNSSSSSDEENEPDAKRTKPNPEDEAAKNLSRKNAWKDFQASMTTTETPKDEDTPKQKMVSVEKRYLFAGEEVVEVVQVAEDSADAKKWPRWTPPDESGQTVQPPEEEDAVHSITATTQETSPAPTSKPPPNRRPGPRKSKTQLSALPSSSKPKKITMLEKSAMDWRSHVGSPADSGLKDELEANRRGGGYLEKVEFLERVQERKEEVLEHNKGTKRRRT